MTPFEQMIREAVAELGPLPPSTTEAIVQNAMAQRGANGTMMSSNTSLGDEVAQRFGSRFGPAASAVERGLTAARPVAQEFTGLPSIQRGTENLAAGRQDRNPMQMIQGAGQVGIGLLPYVGAAGIGGAAPVTTTGAVFAVPQLDTSMPQAQAAPAAPEQPQPGMPPLPTRDPREVPPPPAAAAPQEDPSWTSTLWQQVQNNAARVGDFATGLYDEAKGLMSGPAEFKPPSFEEWAEKNAKEKLAAAAEAERRSTQNIPNVNSRTADQVRAREAARAQQLRAEVQSAYGAEVARSKAEYDRQRNMRFSERNPSINAALTMGPALLAAGRYRGAVRQHNNDIRNAMLQRGPNAAQRDEIAALISSRPSAMPYIAQGVAGTTAGKGVMDFYDLTSMPADSDARSKARNAYIPFDDEGNWAPQGLIDTAAGYASRAALVAGMTGAAPLTTRGLSSGQLQKAATKAGLPNVAAQRARLKAEKQVAQIEDERSALAARRSQRSQADQARQGDQGTGGGGRQGGRQQGRQGSGDRLEDQGRERSDRRNRTSNNTPFSASLKNDVKDSFVANNGKITEAEVKAIAPGASPKAIQDYITYLNKVKKTVGINAMREMHKEGLLKAGVGVIGANAMLSRRPEE